MSTQQWIAMIVLTAFGALLVKTTARWPDDRGDGGRNAWKMQWRFGGFLMLFTPLIVLVVRLVE